MSKWRRGGDLNPGHPVKECDGLANRSLKPLGHLSFVNKWLLPGSNWVFGIFGPAHWPSVLNSLKIDLQRIEL